MLPKNVKPGLRPSATRPCSPKQRSNRLWRRPQDLSAVLYVRKQFPRGGTGELGKYALGVPSGSHGLRAPGTPLRGPSSTGPVQQAPCGNRRRPSRQGSKKCCTAGRFPARTKISLSLHLARGLTPKTIDGRTEGSAGRRRVSRIPTRLVMGCSVYRLFLARGSAKTRKLGLLRYAIMPS